MTFQIVKGDILSADVDCIVHQTNCVTISAAGLARTIFNKYPWADIYRHRQEYGQPGEIHVRCRNNFKVVGLNGQFFPGKPKYQFGFDSAAQREEYFRLGLACLEEYLNSVKSVQTIALPFGIGCGLAGGSWGEYFNMIQHFAKRLAKNQVEVTVYQLRS